MGEPVTKPNMYRVYLAEEETTLMREICERTELGQTELLTKLMSAALRAVKANDYRLSLPIRLNVADAVATEGRSTKIADLKGRK